MNVLKLQEFMNATPAPLNTACKLGYLDIVKILCESGCNVNIIDDLNTTPLHDAALKGFSDIVVYLCGRPDIDINITRTGAYDGQTALMYAAWKCSDTAVQALITAQADVNMHAINNGYTALMYAIFNEVSPANIFRVLLAAGADIDASELDEKTALHLACENNELELVKLLCESGANINAVGMYNITPLMFAAYYSSSDIVIYLCKRSDLDINIARIGPYKGQTALLYAAWKCSAAAVQALITAGADVNASNIKDSYNALMYAIRNINGKAEADKIIKILLAAGVPDNIESLVQKEEGFIFRDIYIKVHGTPYTASGGRRKRLSNSRRLTRKNRRCHR